MSYLSQTVQTLSRPPLFTKFMGSKAAIVDRLFSQFDRFEYDAVLDGFSGSGVVAYEFKKRMKQVATNDILNFSKEICKAVVENSHQRIDRETVEKLVITREDAPSFVRDNYAGIYFDYDECYFLDSLWTNLSELRLPEYSKHLVIAAVCRACQKKYPRGIFTFTGGTGQDGRKDFKISLEQHFRNAIELFNGAVFSNGRSNSSYCGDLMNSTDIPDSLDLVYLDPPYWTPLADNDYVRRYHFVEGYSKYWRGLKINDKTRTKKFDSSNYPTPFAKRETAEKALAALFERFSRSIIAVSYSSNSLPTLRDMRRMIQNVKQHVEVHLIPHRYSFGNVGSVPRNRVDEYLFLGYDDDQRPIPLIVKQ